MKNHGYREISTTCRRILCALHVACGVPHWLRDTLNMTLSIQNTMLKRIRYVWGHSEVTLLIWSRPKTEGWAAPSPSFASVTTTLHPAAGGPRHFGDHHRWPLWPAHAWWRVSFSFPFVMMCSVMWVSPSVLLPSLVFRPCFLRLDKLMVDNMVDLHGRNGGRPHGRPWFYPVIWVSWLLNRWWRNKGIIFDRIICK